MEKLIIQGSTSNCQVLVGETLSNLCNYSFPVNKAIIITDKNVYQIHGNAFPKWPIILIGTGEATKNMKTVEYILHQLIQLEADRSSFIVGIGGGVVCDITGFVASCYMRGVSFGLIPTTFLSQVDASIGGKNGINFNRYKNMIGFINQPKFVICDMTLLRTLPDKELSCGFGEVVKHALIADRKMFEFLEKNYNKALTMDMNVIEYLIYNSILIKISVVEKDEHEKGLRRVLNFGHTIGHSIEKSTNKLSHGEAISIGIVAATKVSVIKGLLSAKDLERIGNLLKIYGYPCLSTRTTAR
ncbi:MAG: 3-dehydroquinate synthase [Bacteroidales bacterium]|jgi:3-dehydroquinate synthase|nr:3-dehydroquinate synthase [Bacteroidales bacterium]